jgi:hypothetical protein
LASTAAPPWWREMNSAPPAPPRTTTAAIAIDGQRDGLGSSMYSTSSSSGRSSSAISSLKVSIVLRRGRASLPPLLKGSVLFRVRPESSVLIPISSDRKIRTRPETAHADRNARSDTGARVRRTLTRRRGGARLLHRP